MDRGFYNEEVNFEELIRTKADQYSVYPSEKVWKGISSSLHRRKYLYGTGLLLLLALMSYVATDRLFFNPGDQTITLRTAPDAYRSAFNNSMPASSSQIQVQPAVVTAQNLSIENPASQEDFPAAPAQSVYPLSTALTTLTAPYLARRLPRP